MEMNHNSFAYGLNKVRAICLREHFFGEGSIAAFSTIYRWWSKAFTCIYTWWARIKPKGPEIRPTLINDPIERTGSLPSSTFLFYSNQIKIGMSTWSTYNMWIKSYLFWNKDLLHINIDYLLFAIFVIFDDWTWRKTKVTRSVKVHIDIS